MNFVLESDGTSEVPCAVRISISFWKRHILTGGWEGLLVWHCLKNTRSENIRNKLNKFMFGEMT